MRAAPQFRRRRRSALHPARGPEGVLLRTLPGAGVTLVNGSVAVDGPLADGDFLTIGPFQFLLSAKGPFPAVVAAEALARLEADKGSQQRQEQEKEALRIQAAAVVAQQAALGEEELRLQQRRSALEQQQEQLSAHLEEKRQRLADLREQLKAEHAAVRDARAEHAARQVTAQQELDELRRDIVEGREQLQADRRRLLDLRRRLKQRWHRHWVAERAAMRRREEEVAAQWSALAREEERLQGERQRLAQDRLVLNGDVELARRHQQAAWDDLRKVREDEKARQAEERRELAKRQAALDERELVLADGERGLVAEQQLWQHTRRALEREAEGLDNRVRNFRRKIFDHEQEVRRLEIALFSLHRQAQQGTTTAETPAPVPVEVTLPVPVEAPARPTVSELPLEQLERLSGEVADQREILAEYCDRLAQTQQQWQRMREAAAAELEALAHRLEERERDIDERDQRIGGSEARLRQQQRESSHLQRYLEGWQARMTARESSWHSERDRLLLDVQNREQLTEQRLRTVSLVQQRWTRRRRREVEWLQTERTACEKLRHEVAGLREEWLHRSAELEQQERTLTERRPGHRAGGAATSRSRARYCGGGATDGEVPAPLRIGGRPRREGFDRAARDAGR